MKQNVEALGMLGVDLDEIWTSPLTRARETAELLADIPWFDGELKIVDILGPCGDLKELADGFRRLRGIGSLALVGHEPDLGVLAGYLLAGRPIGALTFKKGGVACIEVIDFGPPVSATLRWMLTPKQMRSMAKSREVQERDV
jgi:phosphohistidine phosphatase